MFSVVIISYSIIFITVEIQNSLRKGELQHKRAASREKEKRLAKTIRLVIGLLCFWLSFVLLFALEPNKNYGIAYITGVTASLANSAISAVIYFYCNSFRQALKNIVKGGILKRKTYSERKRQSFVTKLNSENDCPA